MLDDVIRDKCGVFGIWGVDNASEYAYLALHNLQHRGQEHCGIVTKSQRKFYKHWGEGIVQDAFSDEILKKLKGRAALGHTRYRTEGSSNLKNAQPLYADTKNGKLAIAHNGEFANWKGARKKLKEYGHIFTTNSDTEIVLANFSYAPKGNIEEIMRFSFRKIKPAYSIGILTANELIGIRDPRGVRPLVIGKIGDAYAIASETCAFDIIGAEYIGEVERGEMVVINDNGLNKIKLFPPEERLACIFEHVYISMPNSFSFGSEDTNSVIRKEFGKQLAREHPADADVVIPVPDSGNHAALGYSEESKIGFDFGLIRSHYIGRTFIEPTQQLRDAKVKKKHHVNKSVLDGKRIVLVDDSIVRGTTSKKLINIIRDAGAKEVHVRISSPPYKYGCYLGVDTHEKEKLIAYTQKNNEEIKKFINADSLGYLSLEGMLKNKFLSKEGFCTYCFDGKEKISKK
ncbi:MAG: amidophosphoribosyltransferase [Nanoarchaeota archaeon]